jgi:hypothetical protein
MFYEFGFECLVKTSAHFDFDEVRSFSVFVLQVSPVSSDILPKCNTCTEKVAYEMEEKLPQIFCGC